jgi:uncharacterized protein (TIGR03663 family)
MDWPGNRPLTEHRSVRTAIAVGAITGGALIARVIGLGQRVFHWDEGRVGYWTLRYMESGVFEYRPIIHGPFLPLVNSQLFSLIGPSDFSARLLVAIVGGLLPAAAWLFREHLRDSELIALALLLAANPLLIYYSRFMRNDVLVASFMLFAVGFSVRLYDTRNPMYLYAGTGVFALGFTTKENALLYPLVWLGAMGLLLDHRLVVFQYRHDSWRLVIGETVARIVREVRGWGVHIAVSAALFVVLFVFFYAPRPELWGALSRPALLPTVIESATLGTWDKVYSTWISGEGNPYLPFLGDFLETLAFGATPVSLLAVAGCLADRYAGERPRELVAFAGYWGVASILGYPLATDIKAPWATVHAVVPLAIPAAVGAGLLYRWSRQSIASRNGSKSGLAVLLILLVTGGVIVPAVDVAYLNSTSEANKEVLQWAQPSNEMKPTLRKVMALSERHDGTDVLLYGTRNPSNEDEILFYVRNESSLGQPPPGGPNWHSRLPLPWYLERADANVTSSSPDMDPTELREGAPPIVIAYSWDRDEIAPNLPGYAAYQHGFKLWGEEIVIFIDDTHPPDHPSIG